MKTLALLALVAVAQPGPGQSPPPSAQPSAPAAPRERSRADTFAQQLQAIDDRVARIADLRADFEQRKHTALLKEPLVSLGTCVVRGSHVRWETRSPRPSMMSLGGGDGGEIRIYYPEAKVVEVYQTGGNMRELSGTPLPRLEMLRKQFTIESLDAAMAAAPPSGGDRYLAARLAPVGEELKKSVQEVWVLIDTSVPCISRLVIIDADGERTEIVFKNVRINTGVTQSEVELKVPEGTTTSRPQGGIAPDRSKEPPRR